MLAWIIQASGAGLAADAHIDRIERFGTREVIIHFDTEARRTYELQYIDALTCSTNLINAPATACSSNGVPAGAWKNLFVVPAVPFANHYVIPDTGTNRHRFYRLRVTP